MQSRRVLAMVGKFDNIKDAWSLLADFQHVFLSTMEENQPRVRPVTLVRLDDKLWITTDTWSKKVEQIRKNPKVEFSFTFREGDEDCCMRVAGSAEIVKDTQTKAKLARRCDFFNKHWKDVNDPNYTLLLVNPAEIVIVAPQETTRMKV